MLSEASVELVLTFLLARASTYLTAVRNTGLVNDTHYLVEVVVFLQALDGVSYL
jgi:hypothetical protein